MSESHWQKRRPKRRLSLFSASPVRARFSSERSWITEDFLAKGTMGLKGESDRQRVERYIRDGDANRKTAHNAPIYPARGRRGQLLRWPFCVGVPDRGVSKIAVLSIPRCNDQQDSLVHRFCRRHIKPFPTRAAPITHLRGPAHVAGCCFVEERLASGWRGGDGPPNQEKSFGPSRKRWVFLPGYISSIK